MIMLSKGSHTKECILCDSIHIKPKKKKPKRSQKQSNYDVRSLQKREGLVIGRGRERTSEVPLMSYFLTRVVFTGQLTLIIPPVVHL